MFPQPRPFQLTAIEALREGIRAGHKNQLVMSPTGSGKTILAMYLVKEALTKGKRVVFLADRRTLINQTSEVADSLGLTTHSVFMAQHWRFNPALPFQIASIQTVARRGWPESDLYIIDEAHTQLKGWTDHVAKCKGFVIGLSATPFTTGLGNHFTRLINATTMAELTDSGVLVPLRVMTCTPINMSKATTAGGEWTDLAAEERGVAIVGDVVKDWVTYSQGRKTIGFGATIKHCEKLCAEFAVAGIQAAVFTANTKEADRKRLLAEFKKIDSPLKILLSVEALAKGFDNPFVSCILDMRPLRKSLSTAIQMWGRGLRCSPDKKDCLLLDFSGNIVRFNADFEDIYLNGLASLDSGTKFDTEIRKEPEEKEVRKCPQCAFTPFSGKCLSCGFELIKKVSEIEHEIGEMREFRVGKIVIGNKITVWENCVNLCKTKGSQETIHGRAAHLFKSITGEFPRDLPGVYQIKDAPVSRSVINKQKSNRIAFAAALQKSRRS